MQKIIIDGYNVIHADERLKRTAARNLQQAREHLIAMLERYLSDRKLQVTVVFDGRGRLADMESVIPGRLQVVYSSSPGTADELIVSTLEESDNPRAFIVVTSDRTDIGRTARAMGAEVIASEEFLERLRGGPRAPKVGKPEKPAADDADTEYWLKKFSRGKRKRE